mgnify:CR=1 FL=1|jgi:hypothetical protein
MAAKKKKAQKPVLRPFKERIKQALEELSSNEGLITPEVSSLYTPMKSGPKWEWKAFSRADGLFLKELVVLKGAGTAECTKVRSVIAGIIVQCEEATSEDLLNPLGKAALMNIPGGLWFDKRGMDPANKLRERLQITFRHVLFVTPEPPETDEKAYGKYMTRVLNLERVALASQNTSVVIVPSSASVEDLKNAIWSDVIDVWKIELKEVAPGIKLLRSELISPSPEGQ